MTKRKMFLRMITASLLRRRSRMLIALLSNAVGVTILSGLVTIYYDVPRQMGAQLRNYGANMIFLPSGDSLSSEQAAEAAAHIPEGNIVGMTPYRYIRVDLVKRQQSFTAAGTDFAEVQKTSPYFSVDGRYPENNREILVGKEVAETLGVHSGSVVELTYKPETTAASSDSDYLPNTTIGGSAEGWGGGLVSVQVDLGDQAEIISITVDASSQTEDIGGQVEKTTFTNQFIGKTLPLTLGSDVDAITGATLSSQAVVDALNSAKAETANAKASDRTINFTVTGILSTGGEEETYLFMSSSDMAALTGETGRLDVVELSITASAQELEQYVADIAAASEAVTPRLVKRVAKSEAAVLSKLQALVFLVTAVVLLLTMICVSTTMMAVVTERRREIGLRKALGASDGGIRSEFLGEGMFLGMLGGLLGAILGFGFAQLVSIHVFGSSIQFKPLLVPITMIVSMAVSAISCLLPIRQAVRIDPALVLKGE